MKRRSLLIYFITIFLNLVLLIPLFTSYGFLAPINILIYWLSFDRMLLDKKFSCNWTSIGFSAIAFACQWIVIGSIMLAAGVMSVRVIDLLSNPMFLIIFFTTGIEFLVLYFRHDKYLAGKEWR